MAGWSVFVTNHAARRVQERCGLSCLDLIAQVATEGEQAYVHKDNERWIPVSGPTGQGTAIVKTSPGFWQVVTVRDASSATQGEDRSQLTASLLDVTGESFVKLLQEWQEVD